MTARQKERIVRAAMRLDRFRVEKCRAAWSSVLNSLKGRQRLASLENACRAARRKGG